MEIKHIYCCSLCGKEYSEEQDCLKHESRHLQVTKIVEVYYSDSSLSPLGMDVELSNGEILSLRR